MTVRTTSDGWVGRAKSIDTEARNHRIHWDWQQGKTETQLAAEYDLSRQRIHQILTNKFGLTSGRHPKTDVPRICKACGKSYPKGGWRAHFVEEGHTGNTGTGGSRTSERTRAMAKEYDEGGNTREIAAKYGVSRVTVYANHHRVYGTRTRYKNGRGHRWEDNTEVIDLFEKGLPIWLIGDLTGYARDRLQYLKRMWLASREQHE